MLEPREADIPALFLFLVVLPLLIYILLGKWSEAAKKKERISLLAQLAAEEALRAEAMAAASVIPIVSSPQNGVHECARCFAPATTRCSRCKSTRYCSGKCQIIHWRQVHKQECQQLEPSSSCSSPRSAFCEESIPERFFSDNMNSHSVGYNSEHFMPEKVPSANTIYSSNSNGVCTTNACFPVDASQVPMAERRSTDKRHSFKSKKEMLRREDGTKVDSSEEASRSRSTSSTKSMPSKDAYIRNKLRNIDSVVSEGEIFEQQSINGPPVLVNGLTSSRRTMHESCKIQNQHGNIYEPRSNCGNSSSFSSAHGINQRQIGETFLDGGLNREGINSTDEMVELKCSSEMASLKRSVKAKNASHSLGTKNSKSPKSMVKGPRESRSEMDRMEKIADEPKVARTKDAVLAQGSNGVPNSGIMKMMGLRKSPKCSREDNSEVSGDRHKKVKMLFPYEEFMKFFQCEIINLSPRGLLNCGNSCYANAVLQCLTCTKPLTIYLIQRSHSRACCVKDWCLMCELEQHVMTLRESGGPLSPSRILLNMRSINCHIGDGSQEDAHEFLRFLVTSMQSICLEGLGGENKVDPRLQETTFIQHTFGGRLRSKVKCLRCHHESERYENIMDLTLEIYGWVESLEDALTQFTTPEDLDGENMYRCGRCASYVRARKQLRIHEAPNILTIVLKRFQEGRYGKINKCISFPDMLDMIPFMTGRDDIPPLYMLYAVVVHLDTLNASFSGHYVSYVKDLQGNWFRIDDTEVQPVPMSQVMSEEAYILFYMRSCPRPSRTFTGKQAPASLRRCTSKTHKSLRLGPEPSSNFTPEAVRGFSNHTSNGLLRPSMLPKMAYVEGMRNDFSDATSSDWSRFTSSDEASFTTESTRDSFSTVDYTDTNLDSLSSIFNTPYASEYSSHNNTVSCRMFPKCETQTRFVLEKKGYILDSYLSAQSFDRVWKGEDPKESVEYVNYGCNPRDGHGRTSSHCKL